MVPPTMTAKFVTAKEKLIEGLMNDNQKKEKKKMGLEFYILIAVGSLLVGLLAG